MPGPLTLAGRGPSRTSLSEGRGSGLGEDQRVGRSLGEEEGGEEEEEEVTGAGGGPWRQGVTL